MEKLLTIKELSELLQVKKGTIYQWVHMGFVPYIKLGTGVRFKESQIEAWIRKRERKGRSTMKLNIKAE